MKIGISLPLAVTWSWGHCLLHFVSKVYHTWGCPSAPLLLTEWWMNCVPSLKWHSKFKPHESKGMVTSCFWSRKSFKIFFFYLLLWKLSNVHKSREMRRQSPHLPITQLRRFSGFLGRHLFGRVFRTDILLLLSWNPSALRSLLLTGPCAFHPAQAPPPLSPNRRTTFRVPVLCFSRAKLNPQSFCLQML